MWCPSRARRTMMRCTDSAMLSQEPALGVYNRQMPCSAHHWVKSRLRCPSDCPGSATREWGETSDPVDRQKDSNPSLASACLRALARGQASIVGGSSPVPLSARGARSHSYFDRPAWLAVPRSPVETRSGISPSSHEYIDDPDAWDLLQASRTCREAESFDKVQLHLRTRPGTPTVPRACTPVRSRFFFLRVGIFALFDYAIFILAQSHPGFTPGTALLPAIASFMEGM